MQAVVTGIVSPEGDNRVNAIVPHESDDRVGFTFVVRTEPKDVVTGNSERGRGTALADYENVVGVSVRLDHRDLGTRLWSDDNFHAAFVEILNGGERFGGIERGVANKQFEPITAVFVLRCSF